MTLPFEFNPQITLDGIISICTFVIGGISVLIATVKKMDKANAKLDNLTEKVNDHTLKLGELADVILIQTKHDERIGELSRRLNFMDERWERERASKG